MNATDTLDDYAHRGARAQCNFLDGRTFPAAAELAGTAWEGFGGLSLRDGPAPPCATPIQAFGAFEGNGAVVSAVTGLETMYDNPAQPGSAFRSFDLTLLSQGGRGFSSVHGGARTLVDCALSAESWRARCGAYVGAWLDAVAELEALASLGAYAYEHPADPFPELVDAADGPVFDAEGLGHPLLPSSR